MRWLVMYLSPSTLVPSALAFSIFRPQLNPYPDKPRLHFNQDGTFKITVFSDLHFGEDEFSDWAPEQDRKSLQLMRTVLKDEKPQYVVLNGDLITGESTTTLPLVFSSMNDQIAIDTYLSNSTDYIDMIVAPLNEAKVPFSSVHGNHDNQANITHAAEIARENAVAPLSYTRKAPKGVGGTGGEGNYWVPVYPHLLAPRPTLILWFFDSRGGFSPGANSTGVPDWVDESVAKWIAAESAKMERAWGSATDRGALAFVHIPPHRIEAVSKTVDPVHNPGLNEDELGKGSTQDSSDTAQDAPFYNALNKYVKNLHALVSGHDHGNEWCAREPSASLVFCFAKHSGYGGYSGSWWGYGIRNIVFTQRDARVPPDSWIRYENGTTVAHVKLGTAFGG